MIKMIMIMIMMKIVKRNAYISRKINVIIIKIIITIAIS